MTVDAWLEELYERDYALLYRVGRVFLGSNTAQEALIEDQIQETFVRAWQKRASLQNHPNPDGWLVECFRNCLMNACKKQSREWKHHSFSVDAEDAPAVADQTNLSPDEYARSKGQIALLRRLLGYENADIFLPIMSSKKCCKIKVSKHNVSVLMSQKLQILLHQVRE